MYLNLFSITKYIYLYLTIYNSHLYINSNHRQEKYLLGGGDFPLTYNKLSWFLYFGIIFWRSKDHTAFESMPPVYTLGCPFQVYRWHT